MNNAYFSVEKDKNYPRLSILTLKQRALENFVELTATLNIQDIEYIPFLRYHLSDCLIKALKEKQFQFMLTNILTDREQGAIIISVPNEKFAQDECGLKLSTALAYLIGHANIDVLSGKYFAKFILTDAKDAPSKLFSPYTNFTMHTDGAFFNEPTDWVMLTKLAEINSTGGESRLLHLEDWEDFGKYYNHKFSTHPFLF